MKKYFILAAAALTFAACTNDEIVPVEQVVQTVDDGSVRFDAYISRGTTRAGLTGEMNLGQLQLDEAAGGGFGVFGYYTDGERYAGNTKPNFFYNQGVFWTSGAPGSWVYTPIKYWPNEFGNDAISDQIDRVSLFAYAPYVKVDPASGYVTTKNTENITALTRNNATGDPHVKYTATMDPTNTVDLCYGVAAENFTSSNSTSFPNNIEAGKPFIDVTKPDLGGKIKFDFKHALAKLNVQIDAVVNDVAAGTAVDSKTRIWVRSVTFEGITMKGALNLNSIGGSPEWYQIDASGDNKISTGSVTVYDGLKDGREPIGTAATELPASLNPAIIQSAKYDTSTGDLNTTDPNVVGVTKDLQNLFKHSDSGSSDEQKAEPVYVIPTGEQMKVTIVYDVETYDPNIAFYLSDGSTLGSTIQNTITKTVDNFTELKAGKQYVLKLHLGMRTVDFEATVAEWDTPINSADADLPRNNPSFAAAASSSTVLGTITIGAGETAAIFDVRGLTGGETVTATEDGTYVDNTTGSDATANTSGLAKIVANFAGENTTVANVAGTVAVEGGTSHTGGTINVVQNAMPFILANPTITAGTATVTIDDATGSGTVTDDQWTAAEVTVKKKASGATAYVTLAKEYGTGDKFTYAGTTGAGTITLGDNPASGDKYIITVKVGDAPAVTSAEITVE